MLDVLSQAQTPILNSDNIYQNLKALQEDSIFPILMKGQNSCIFIKMHGNKSQYKASISAFQVSLKSDETIKKNNELYATYPEVYWYIEDFDIFFLQH